MPATLSVPFTVSLVCWFVFEASLALRDVVRRQGLRRRDRGTRMIVSFSLGVSILLASLVRAWLPALNTPGRYVFAVVGLVALWLGLALRVWSVVTLGRSFRTYVEVDTDQAVVTSGPYRWVRHPSYTGLLLIALGFGLGAGNWLSLVICLVVPPLGLLPRIAVEESELTRVIGEPYRGYQATTRRLVPGLW